MSYLCYVYPQGTLNAILLVEDSNTPFRMEEESPSSRVLEFRPHHVHTHQRSCNSYILRENWREYVDAKILCSHDTLN